MLTIRRILVPIDFSACSKAALDYAARLAERFQAEIQVLHVWEMPMYPGAGFPELVVHMPNEPRTTLAEFVENRAGHELERMLSELERSGRVKLLTRIDMGDPCDAIVSLAASSGHDLIVMGTHGRTGLSHLVMGSVAEKVVRRAPCPVLVIRRPEGERVKENKPQTVSTAEATS